MAALLTKASSAPLTMAADEPWGIWSRLMIPLVKVNRHLGLFYLSPPKQH